MSHQKADVESGAYVVDDESDSLLCPSRMKVIFSYSLSSAISQSTKIVEGQCDGRIGHLFTPISEISSYKVQVMCWL